MNVDPPDAGELVYLMDPAWPNPIEPDDEIYMPDENLKSTHLSNWTLRYRDLPFYSYFTEEGQLAKSMRQLFQVAIARVLQAYDLPPATITTQLQEKEDGYGATYWTWNVTVKLPPGFWVRTNPSLTQFLSPGQTIYDAYPPTITFFFTGKWGDLQQFIGLDDINPDHTHWISKLIDMMVATFLYLANKDPILQKNIKNTGRNMIRRRVARKIFEQGVGDPYFAHYMSQFVSTIPRRHINLNLKATSPNLFQGGRRRTRKTRRGRRKTRSRK